MNNDLFCRLSVVKAQASIGTEKYPDAATKLKYKSDDYAQSYVQIKEAFRASTIDDILQSYIFDDGFRSSNVGAE